ncbi:hypothetical protein HYX10_00685 [Candidatus Woesearchaeota archaeon]|nr:hypothetical protein [Candidatus Woesearchaeota archaeon]
MDSRDIALGVIGFAVSFFGGQISNQTFFVIGILTLILALWLNLEEHENDIKVLKAQINTQNELKKIWRELDELKLGKGKKR